MIYNIREYTREDTSAMMSLWSDAFGDPSELIDFFSNCCPRWEQALSPSLTVKSSVQHTCWTHFCICPEARQKACVYLCRFR